jgi:hypothetical protein
MKREIAMHPLALRHSYPRQKSYCRVANL